jgi:hypothetical protein
MFGHALQNPDFYKNNPHIPNPLGAETSASD